MPAVMYIRRVLTDRNFVVIDCNRGLRQTYWTPSKPDAEFVADAWRVVLKQPRNGRN